MNSLMRYKNVWLNNQYLISTLDQIQCPLCNKFIDRYDCMDNILSMHYYNQFFCNLMIGGCGLHLILRYFDKIQSTLILSAEYISSSIKIPSLNYDYNLDKTLTPSCNLSELNKSELVEYIKMMKFYA